MELDISKLEKYGEIMSIEGNTAFTLTGTEDVYIVCSGTAELFYEHISNRGVYGLRKHLFSICEGEAAFCFEPNCENGEEYSLQIHGILDTKVIRINPQCFLEFAQIENHSDYITDMINKWINNLSDYSTNFSNKVKVDKEKVVQLISEGKLISFLSEFSKDALISVQSRIGVLNELERQRIVNKIENDETFMKRAVSNLMNVLKTENNDAAENDMTEDSLYKACSIVGTSMGINVSRPKTNNTKTSIDPLSEIARASRIRCRQVTLENKWWCSDNGPLLAFQAENKNPVALIPSSPGKYILHNPSTGEKLVVSEELAGSLEQNAYILFRPLPFKELNLLDIIRFGLKDCWKRDFAVLLIMGAAFGLAGMVIPIISGVLFDSVIPQGEKEYVLQLAFFLIAGTLSGSAFQFVRSFAMLRLETKMDSSIQASVWDRLLSLPVSFFKDYSSGELAMRAMSISEIRKMLSGSTITALLTGIFSFFNLGLLFYYNSSLALAAFILVLSSLFITSLLAYTKMRYQRNITVVYNKLSGFLLQIIEGVSKLKIAGAESRAFFLWSKSFSQHQKMNLKSKTISNLLDTFNSLVPIIASAVIFYLYAKSSASGLSAGSFVAFNAAFISLFISLTALSGTFVSIFGIIPLYESAMPIMKTKPEYDEGKIDPGDLKGDIELSHINFRYKENAPLILKDISLNIKSGEYVAIVGSSGCGKSTLLRVLLGFEKTESGRVYFDGKDIEKVDIRSIRRQIGVVLQNGKLLPGTIFSNIAGSNPNITMEKAMGAVKDAGLEEDINEMPMGMYTFVNEGASTLSGGQRQRLLIARAIVRKPKIVFFDEATSALDNHTQTIVSAGLDKLNATRIVIAHRLSTIINCDRIVVMDKGRIVESGTYKELISRKGMFFEMAKRQMA